MIEPRRGYEAYLLRLWQARGKEGMAWRASLDSAHTGERVGFTRLEDLLGFLEKDAHREALDRARPHIAGNDTDVDRE